MFQSYRLTLFRGRARNFPLRFRMASRQKRVELGSKRLPVKQRQAPVRRSDDLRRDCEIRLQKNKGKPPLYIARKIEFADRVFESASPILDRTEIGADCNTSPFAAADPSQSCVSG
jgi:hypothetical protein